MLAGGGDEARSSLWLALLLAPIRSGGSSPSETAILLLLGLGRSDLCIEALMSSEPLRLRCLSRPPLPKRSRNKSRCSLARKMNFSSRESCGMPLRSMLLSAS
jgi:hypothetical protein